MSAKSTARRIATVLALACGPAPVLPSTEVVALAPGQRLERALEAGQAHRYTLPPATVPGARRLVVEQLGIDVVAVPAPDDATPAAELNGPLGRFDRELFLLGDDVAGLVIRPLAGGVAAGRYAIALAPPPAEPPAVAGRRRQAEAELTAAAALPYGGTNEAMTRAAAHYQAAAAAYAALGDRRQEARALLAAANFRRKLGQAEAAHALYAQARTRWQAQGETGFVADSLVGLGQTARHLGQPAAARDFLEQALVHWQALGRGPERASTLANLGLLAQHRGDFQDALARYRQALEEHRASGDRLEMAGSLLNIGSTHAQLGDAQAALDSERQSLALFRQLGERNGERVALNNLAVLHRRMGEPEEALRLYDQARGLAEALGDRRAEARALHNRGYCYLVLGEVERATVDLERALELRRALADRTGVFLTLAGLGEAADLRGDLPAARRMLEQALEQAASLGHRRTVGVLGRLGRVLARLGDPAAHQRFAEAAAALADRDDPLAEAELRYLHGEALRALGDPAASRAALARALAIWSRLGDQAGEVMARTGLGRTARAAGRLDEARRHLEAALARIETLRTEIANPDLRATFLSARHDAATLLIDVLMSLHAADPGAGHDRAALARSEQARQRRLLDLLAEAEIDLEDAVAPELAERRRDLVRRLSLLARRQQRIALGRLQPSPSEDLDAAVADVQAELDLVAAAIRRRDPRRPAMAAAVSVEAIQQLLEPGTLLLCYALGEERSFLWLVTATAIDSFVLPPRARIEDAARRLHRALGTLESGSGAGDRAAAAALAEMVLAPAAGRLRGRRLAVMADGGLHYVPFAALPLPAADGGPAVADGGPRPWLVERFEIVYPPSAAVLLARRPTPASDRPAATVAVLADPVFDRADPRLPADAVARGSAGESGPPLPAAWSVEALGRLPGSRLEAESIARWVAPERRTLALGFAANRDALGGALATRSIVHFATHAIIDTERPALSGLVLAQLDADGRWRGDGMLRLHDIYRLDLAAELVVLSGCRTALGRALRGEGLQGLTGGFLYGGAQRVLASLWAVADRATADLMDHFYRAHLADALTPAAALRRAQLAIAADRRFRDPYYWAAFVIQGDWR